MVSFFKYGNHFPQLIGQICLSPIFSSKTSLYPHLFSLNQTQLYGFFYLFRLWLCLFPCKKYGNRQGKHDTSDFHNFPLLLVLGNVNYKWSPQEFFVKIANQLSIYYRFRNPGFLWKLESSTAYVIYHPEKLRLSDIFCTLVFGTTLVDSELIEASVSSNVDGAKVGNVGGNLITAFTWILQRILIWFSGPLSLLGLLVEFTLNLFSLNGGLLRLLRNLVTGSLVIPNKESKDYPSICGYIDERTDLYKTSSMIAAKIVYENKAYVENVITNHWKMYFVGHYNFWNEYLKDDATQAFICCDRKENAQLVMVSFRGTQTFNGKDWATNLDLSWMSMGEMGRVHVGFMKALGLQDEKDYQKGWPKKYAGSRMLAYYTIRATLKTLLQQNENAKITVTGHSLGGALAILFPSILVLHQEDDIMSSLLGVYTFGQPRVGNKDFGDYMKTQLNVIFKRYYRVVFRYDVVPRIPFDDPISQFVHFGGCVYYRSWYKGELMKEEPNRNYFNILYIPSKYFNAWLDLVRAVFARIRPGKEFQESWISISFRIIGLLIPGVASHSPRDYVNGARLARVTIKDEETPYSPRDYVNGLSL